jgi:hypothetical protein
LLARGRFKAVPFLVAVPVIYMVTLRLMGPIFTGMPGIVAGMKTVILMMAGFNLLLFGVAAWFTWRKSASPA